MPALDGGLQLRPLPHVGLDRDDPAVVLLDQAGGLLQVIRRGERVTDGLDIMAQVDGDDVRAFFREPHRVAAALAARGARDEGDFALDASHVCPFVSAEISTPNVRILLSGKLDCQRPRM